MLPENVELIIGLPYRVGVWISRVDDVEGSEDDRREMRALENIIKSITRLHNKSPFMAEVAHEILEHPERWRAWRRQAGQDEVLSDCKKVVALLQVELSRADLKSFRVALMHIARVVAEAYGEFDFENKKGLLEEESENILGTFLANMIEKFKTEHDNDHDAFMNVSETERAAIHELAKALKGEETGEKNGTA